MEKIIIALPMILAFQRMVWISGQLETSSVSGGVVRAEVTVGGFTGSLRSSGLRWPPAHPRHSSSELVDDPKKERRPSSQEESAGCKNETAAWHGERKVSRDFLLL